MNFLKNNYFVAFLLVGLAALFVLSVSANAEEGSPEDLKWHVCANKFIHEWQNKSMEEQDADFCPFIGSEPGPGCERAILGLYSVGMLNAAMNDFYYNVVIVPKCGEHPAN